MLFTFNTINKDSAKYYTNCMIILLLHFYLGMQRSMQKLQFAQRARMNAGEEDNRLAVIPSSSHTDVQDSTCGCHMSR